MRVVEFEVFFRGGGWETLRQARAVPTTILSRCPSTVFPPRNIFRPRNSVDVATTSARLVLDVCREETEEAARKKDGDGQREKHGFANDFGTGQPETRVLFRGLCLVRGSEALRKRELILLRRHVGTGTRVRNS